MSAVIDRLQPAITHQDLMLATPGKLFSAKGWIYELKHDGFRCLASKCGDVVRLLSRNGRDMGVQFPELVEELRPIDADFVLDGELVIVDDGGYPQWERLRWRAVRTSPLSIRRAAHAEPAAIFGFDLLWVDGRDLRTHPLIDRKAALHDLLPYRGRVRYAGHFADSCAEIWQLALQFQLEGIVAKDSTSPYRAGRSDRWLKIKTAAGAERERLRRP